MISQKQRTLVLASALISLLSMPLAYSARIRCDAPDGCTYRIWTGTEWSNQTAQAGETVYVGSQTIQTTSSGWVHLP